MFYYIYVLQSEKDNGIYIGFAPDLISRLKKHNNGEVFSTKYRRPLKLIYYEAYKDKRIALKREKQLKGGKANVALRKRLCLNKVKKVKGRESVSGC